MTTIPPIVQPAQPGGPPDPDPAHELEQLQQQLATATREQDDKAAEIASLGRRIKGLQSLIQERQKAKADYEKAYPAFLTDWTELTQYQGYESQELEDLLGQKVDDIRRKVDHQMDVVSAAETARSDADDAVHDAEADLDEAAATLQAAQRTDDELKAFTATVKDRLARLEKIRAEVNASREADLPAVAYWRLVLRDTDRDGTGDFAAALDSITPLMTPDQLPTRMALSRQALSAATEDHAAKQRALAQAKAAAASAAKALDEAVKGFDALTQADIEAIDKPPAP